ncbi:hypothetical protein DFH06DRAFT_1037923, partial [Mycena polygramma]
MQVDAADEVDEPATHNDDEELPEEGLEDIVQAQQFIAAVRNASLDNGDLDPDCVQRLRHPIEEELDVSDPDLRYSLDLFIATSGASDKTYTDVREANLRRHPEDEILTHYQIKKKVEEMSGVVPIVHHMCPNTCIAY